MTDASLPPDSDVLAKAKALRAEISPLPWNYDDDTYGNWQFTAPNAGRPVMSNLTTVRGLAPSAADAAFIAAAPELLDGLIEEVERLRTKNDVMRQEIADQTSDHAAALGRLGGQKGGKARAQSLTPKQRSRIARAAAQARWRKNDDSDEVPHLR